MADEDAAAAALPVRVPVMVLDLAEALCADAEAALAEASAAAELDEALATAMVYGKVVCNAVKVARRDVVPVSGSPAGSTTK